MADRGFVHRLATNRALSLLLIAAALVLFVGALAPGFLSAATLRIVWTNAQVLMFVALGLLPVLLARGIDVSVGSTLGLSAAVVAMLSAGGWPLSLSVLAALAVGLAAGALNGLLVAGLGVPSIVATLGTMGALRGVMLITTGGEWIEALPSSLKALAARGGALAPTGVALLMLLALLAVGLRTRRGRWVAATGDNAEAARHLGLPVTWIRGLTFVWAGLTAAAAGVVYAAQIGFVPNQAGTGIELRAIAALVLGGVSLLGGSGTVLGAAVGVLFLTAIDSALVFLKVPAYWNDLIGGAMLLAVLLIDGRVRRHLDARTRAKRYARTSGGADAQ